MARPEWRLKNDAFSAYAGDFPSDRNIPSCAAHFHIAPDTAMAVLVAQFLEEYLFPGSRFRALDREWGKWRAVIGRAAFFAVYHPPLSWPPVFRLGAANRVWFKKTGRLEPRVALHMVYNVVVSASNLRSQSCEPLSNV